MSRKLIFLLIPLWIVCSAIDGEAATLMVTNTNDSGSGSLREAITLASAGDTIEFEAGVNGPIMLESPLPPLVVNLEILGPGAHVITIDGDGQHQVFLVEADTTITISGLTIMGGFTDADSRTFGIGGGIWNLGTLALTDSVVSGNFAEVSGGGIANDGILHITRSTISGNSVALFGSGGGIENFEAELTIVDSTISGNAADIGGGISNNSDGGVSQLSVRNSTISGNTADFEGGGIDNFGGEVELVFSTVANNSADFGGGGIANLGDFLARNSLVANNPTGGDCDDFGFSFQATGNNLATDGTCPDFTETTPTALALGPLADNGGPTQTHALAADSVAVDAASDCTEID
ncbi:MAG: choice-of-anchor Q domain-containing protein, partial [Wenzhouxiangella sp.]